MDTQKAWKLGTRSVARIGRLHEMREQRANRRETTGNVNMNVAQAGKTPNCKVVAELEDVYKSFGEGDNKRMHCQQIHHEYFAR